MHRWEVTPMAQPIRSLEDLHEALSKLKSGEQTILTYSGYDLLFPPGGQNEDARRRATEVGRQYNCVIDDFPKTRNVVFRKL
jgi:hypothetical protein